MDSLRDFPGCNTAAYFAARGLDLSPEQSRELVLLLLRLCDLGAICVASCEPSRGSSPSTPAPAGVSCGGRGELAGREDHGAGALEGPTVYNMGPSAGISGSEQ
jgi:hypothetical protein